MFHCCSDERSTSRIKDPVSTPTCSACFKLGTRTKDTCADLRSHVPESELPHCFAFTDMVKPNVSTMDTAPLCEEPAQSPSGQVRVACGFEIERRAWFVP